MTHRRVTWVSRLNIPIGGAAEGAGGGEGVATRRLLLSRRASDERAGGPLKVSTEFRATKSALGLRAVKTWATLAAEDCGVVTYVATCSRSNPFDTAFTQSI
jgi:hypothetical protein